MNFFRTHRLKYKLKYTKPEDFWNDQFSKEVLSKLSIKKLKKSFNNMKQDFYK